MSEFRFRFTTESCRHYVQYNSVHYFSIVDCAWQSCPLHNTVEALCALYQRLHRAEGLRVYIQTIKAKLEI